ncbi:MAG: hypothetical protein PUJ21_07405 [Clostridia bacterium]|nr:hypothetical protein [Clostridia bacterium]MDY6185033.1 hypothetical protein [Eubacteriales bacterium]
MRAKIYKAVGLALCVLPPALTALSYFPLWLEKRESTFSLLSVCVLFLCALPFHRILREKLKSPSAWQMWLILLILLSLFRNIIDGLRAVACVAVPTSLLGAVFFALAKRETARNETDLARPHEEDKA